MVKVVRFLVAVLLVLVAFLNLAGFTFLAYALLMGAEVHVRGGAFTILFSLAATVLSLRGAEALTRNRLSVR